MVKNVKYEPVVNRINYISGQYCNDRTEQMRLVATWVKDWGQWDKKGNFLEEDAGLVEEENLAGRLWRTCRMSGWAKVV